MAIYDIDGKQLYNNRTLIPLEHGSIANTGEVTNTLNNALITFRSAFPIAINGNKLSASVENDSSDVSSVSVFEYGQNFVFIQTQTLTNGSATLSDNTKYVRFMVTLSGADYDPRNIVIDGGVNVVKNFPVRSGYEKFLYEVYDGVFGSGVLMLPPNYSIDGKPVPLLVFIHGSNGFSEWDSNMGVLRGGSTYYPYMEYLRDEGFAILDVYGWTSKYLSTANMQTLSEPNKSNTWVLPITYSAFRSGIRYVLSRYNLDKNNVSIYCKSLGGGLANMFAIKSDIPLVAICELAPTVDSLFWGGWGQSVAGRTIIADQLKLTGNVNSVFLQTNFDWRSTNGKAFIDANIDKISGFNAGWNYNGQTLTDKLQDSYDKDYTNTGYCREVLYPIKIWVAPDDTNISYPKILEFVAQCKNNSEDVTLREMPENTGGHHSVDNDPSAPTEDVTTALGIAYEDVPSAYVEMVEFIRSRQ